MDKLKNVTKLDDSDESQVVGGKKIKHFYAKPCFKHPRYIDPELILFKRQNLSGNKTVNSDSEN